MQYLTFLGTSVTNILVKASLTLEYSYIVGIGSTDGCKLGELCHILAANDQLCASLQRG